jgi:hypothetical protein
LPSIFQHVIIVLEPGSVHITESIIFIAKNQITTTTTKPFNPKHVGVGWR